MTATLTRDNRDSLGIDDAERALLAAGYQLTVYPTTSRGTCIARLNRGGFHATVVLCHDHVHQIVTLSRQTAPDQPLRTVMVATMQRRDHEWLPLSIEGAVHIAEHIAMDIVHAAELAAAPARWAVAR